MVETIAKSPKGAYDRSKRTSREAEPPVQLSRNARLVLERRYLAKDQEGNLVETPEDMFRRVARNIAMAELKFDPHANVARWEREFYNLMARLDFIPNSPTLMNAGRDLQQLSACFVLPIDDSIESIFEVIKNTALIHKSGGGTGFSFSRIRPKNDIVSTSHGRSSGPVSFMRVFNEATEAINQGGFRRGANMAILRYDHPDILEFIRCKEEEGRISNFNISVGIDEEFMRKVENDEKYDLINPRTGRSVGQARAKLVFDTIVDGAWRNGEPGIVFLDRINRANPTPRAGTIESTNPCVTGDTWVLTPDGPARVIDIIGKPTLLLLNGEFHETTRSGFFETGLRKVLELVTDRGYRLKLTADHPVRVVIKQTRHNVYAEWRPAGELKSGDTIVLSNNRSLETWSGRGTFEHGYLLGLFMGDGTVKQDECVIDVQGRGDGTKSVREFAERCAKTVSNRAGFKEFSVGVPGSGEFNLTSKVTYELAEEYGISSDFRAATLRVEQTSSEFHRGFLQGIFDVDGSVHGTHEKGVSIRLTRSDLETLRSIQRMLHRFGITSTICRDTRPEAVGTSPDGKGGTRGNFVGSQYELVISGDDVSVFADKVGFGNIDKKALLLGKIQMFQRNTEPERFVTRVVSVEFAGEEKVYDVQIPGVNAFDANGLMVHNCGEQPLLPYESCNLGSINLANFVSNEKVDISRLTKVVHTAVRFLDNVIEMNKYPLPKIEEMTKANRKIGLGVMGFADMLIRMGIPYDSEEGLNVAEEVMKLISEESKKASHQLAKERGAFPNFPESIYVSGGMELRNATTTTIAPTGTISIIAGVSSGIEPLFAVGYVRNILDNENLVEVHPLFEEIARREGFYSEELMRRISETLSIQSFHEIPERVRRLFVTAHDIPPSWHVRMQAAFQKYTDNAVSKTVNFPNKATREDIADVFFLAYRTGCKGVTVYRDKSRKKQVLSASTSEAQKQMAGEVEESFSLGPPRPRPEVIMGSTRKLKTGCGNLYVTINYDEKGRPFEVFSVMGKAGGCAASQCEAIARLISFALRSGADVKEIVRQLKGISCHSTGWGRGGKILSCADAIARAVEKSCEENSIFRKSIRQSSAFTDASYRLSAEEPPLRGACPDCGGIVVHSEGCVVCRSCGYSDCS